MRCSFGGGYLYFRAAIACFLGVFLLSSACAESPIVKSLNPSRGPERTLVVVEGSALNDGVVIWDVGLPTEKRLPRTVQGATMFSVPPKTRPGRHPVRIETAAGRSSILTFTVEGAAPTAVPRIDGITLASSNFDEAGKVRVAMYIQGANIDVGAKVFVDGVETSSLAHKAISNNLFGADPAALGYPIRHYLSRVLTETSYPLGSSVRIEVVNEGNESSAEAAYRLPQDRQTISSSGDGIADEQKLNGYDNGNGKIDIRALGADPYRKIIFLQIDVMDKAARPIESSAGTPGTLELVQQMFANAPVINPYGPNGIDLVIDASRSVPDWLYLEFLDEDDPVRRTGGFWKMKKQNFDPKREGLYHYAIWGRNRLDYFSGYSNVDFSGTQVGDSFMVTMSDFPIEYQTVQSQAETVAHELGHNLGQKHGGTNHSQFKPNYWSVMSYAWQLRSGRRDADRMQYPTCTPIYYATPAAAELHGQPPAQRNTRIDYSEGMGPTLVGNNQSLDERKGVCGLPIDWNRNGHIDTTPVNATIDDQAPIDQKVEDWPNWPNLRFDGPRLGGRHDPL